MYRYEACGMRKCLITGGAGFVGSHLADKLVAQGDEVTVMDDFSNGSRQNISHLSVKLMKVDISRKFAQATLKKLASEKFDVIYHLACFPRSMSFDDPFRDVEVNVAGMVNILELAKRTKSKVIFSSNSGIYGTPERLPINEDCEDMPSSPYDIDKLAAEYFVKIYSRTFSIPATIFRFGTVYGSRQKVSPTWKPVIAEFVCKMLKKTAPTVDGDGKQTRDFIHVSDIVEALLRATEVETDLKPIVLSSNTELSINQLYNIIAKLLNFKKPPKKAPPKIGDVRRMWYDNAHAKKVLRWSPKMTLMEALKKDVIPYYSKQVEAGKI
jgi:UDP-glucose 4-epimerase